MEMSRHIIIKIIEMSRCIIYNIMEITRCIIINIMEKTRCIIINIMEILKLKHFIFLEKGYKRFYFQGNLAGPLPK